MDKNTLSILIHAPISAVFDFTLDPKNTPRWISSIQKEWTNEWPPKIGTVYRQKLGIKRKTMESAIVITGFQKNKQLDFHLVNGTYSCSYQFSPNQKGTWLTYSEENGVGQKLVSPLKMKNLQTLKTLIETHAVRTRQHK
jgi:hypothetical protein